MQEKKNYIFNGILEEVKRNRITAAVFLPHHIIIGLPKGRSRVTGIINGEPFSQSIQSRKDGSRFFTIGAALRKAARLETGDPVSVSFRILGTKSVDLPDNFESVTSEIRRPKKNVGSKRNGLLSDYADAIRNLDSRVRKAFEIVQRSKSSPQTAQPNKKNRNK
jgi:hypothetical protein